MDDEEYFNDLEDLVAFLALLDSNDEEESGRLIINDGM